MADDADLAQRHIDAGLASSLDALQRHQHDQCWRAHCIDCEEPLPEHRQARGICVPCQTAREIRSRQQAVGA